MNTPATTTRQKRNMLSLHERLARAYDEHGITDKAKAARKMAGRVQDLIDQDEAADTNESAN